MALLARARARAAVSPALAQLLERARPLHSTARFPRTRTTSSANATASGSALAPQLIVRNGAAAQGRLAVQLPLPGVAGLTPVTLGDAQRTVQDVLEAVRRADPTLKTVELTTPDGTKLARTVQISELASMPFCLRLNHVNVLVENERSEEGLREYSENVGFATVKAAVEQDSRLHMLLNEYYKLCHNAGAEEAVANKWLRELQRRNLVVHFHQSANPELKNTIILRPYSLESVLTVRNALDAELYNIKHDRRKKESQLRELESELRRLTAVETDVQKAALRLPNAQKWLALSALTSFYGGLMYCVWDVYSWDVMEPITYFISFTAVLGNSFYYSVTKKDPTYSNIWQKRYAARVALVSEERKFDPHKLETLRAQIGDLRNDIGILARWEAGGALEGQSPVPSAS